MHVGVCHVTLRLAENDNLKGKRRVARSLTARARSKFNVAIAEVEDNDLWQILTLGISCVSNDPRHANEVMSSVLDFIQTAGRGEWEVVDYITEVISGV